MRRIALLVLPCCLARAAPGGTKAAYGPAPYQEIQRRLANGWNTWNTRSVLSHVLLPEGFALNLAFKQHYWLDEAYLDEGLIGRRGPRVERVRPGWHAYDGSYTELELTWEQLQPRIESATEGDDLLMLLTPLSTPELPVKLILETGMLWNRPSSLSRDAAVLTADLPGRSVTVHASGRVVEDPHVKTLTPYVTMPVEGPIGISTGRPRSLQAIRATIARARADLERRAERFGDLAEASLVIQSALAWNLIYEPRLERVVSTVGRLWNRECGGYALFGWDNFFLAYLTSLESRDLAYANVIEHLRGKTEEGFIPNDNQGNGRKSWDRSQPPVGSLMVKEIYKRYPEKWLLEATFDDLIGWNRWWLKRRRNGPLLSWGSHVAKNPFKEPDVHTMTTARYESGMDDSPMYADVVFNEGKAVMELHDVGLNSLYIADCRALAEMAHLLGKTAEPEELESRARALEKAMEGLWSEDVGLYLNRRTDTGELSYRFSPTVFYPLLAGVPSPERAQRMVKQHFFNPEEFWGEWILPSIARNDPAFARQRYWKGAIWPPTNFLTYLGLRRYGLTDAQRALAEKSLKLILGDWRRKGYVSENTSALTRRGDDPRLSSDPFHSWGALFAVMAFIEEGFLPAPELELKGPPPGFRALNPPADTASQPSRALPAHPGVCFDEHGRRQP